MISHDSQLCTQRHSNASFENALLLFNAIYIKELSHGLSVASSNLGDQVFQPTHHASGNHASRASG